MKFTGCFTLLLLAAACGSGGGVGDAGFEPPHLLWSADPQSLDNPFPDARGLTATGLTLRPDFYRPFVLPKAITGKSKAFFKGYADAAATQVHGVGNFGPTLLRPSEAVDPASLLGTIARLRKTAAGYEILEAALAIEHATQMLEGSGKTLDLPDGGKAAFPEFFLARCGVPLPENEEGLLVVKKGLKTLAGVPFGRGRAWDAAKPELGAIAAALGIDANDILLTLPQKAGPVGQAFSSLAAWVDANPAAITVPPKAFVTTGASQRPVGVWRSSEPDWTTIKAGWLELASYGRPSTEVGTMIVGEIAARDLRQAEVWPPAWVADPSKAPVAKLPFVLTLPAGPKPLGGWPTVIGAHGINGRNIPVNGETSAYCLRLAQLLAAKGIACLGIDAPSHGLRGSAFDFFEVEKLPVMRDHFREMNFDLMQVSRAFAGADVDGDGDADVAPRLGYLGNSLGGIMGGGFVPYAGHIDYAVLNVPGGGLSNILVSPEIHDLIGLLIAAKTGGDFGTLEYQSGFMIFRATAQLFLEPADPVNLAAALPKTRAVLVQEGLGDRTIPNLTTENLAAAMKLDVPDAGIVGTAPLQVKSVTDLSKFLSPEQLQTQKAHDMFEHLAPVRAQAVKFLETKGAQFQLP